MKSWPRGEGGADGAERSSAWRPPGAPTPTANTTERLLTGREFEGLARHGVDGEALFGDEVGGGATDLVGRCRGAIEGEDVARGLIRWATSMGGDG